MLEIQNDLRSGPKWPQHLLLSLIWPLAFALLLLFSGQFGYSGRHDTDEGNELIKGYLHHLGYDLYSEIWNDQPPLATLVMSRWIDWFGIDPGQIGMLFFLGTALLLASFFLIISLEMGPVTAFLGTGLLILTPHFVRLSVSVMIGMPALGVATAAIALLIFVLHRSEAGKASDPSRLTASFSFGLILSGLLMGIATQIKLFVVIVLPGVALLLMLLSVERKGSRFVINWLNLFSLLSRWFGTFVLALILIEWLFGAFRLDTTLLFHFEPVSGDYNRQLGWSNERVIENNLFFLAFGGLGLLELLRTRSLKWSILPLGWAAGGLVFVFYHRPTWYHHLMLLNIPLVWLGCYWLLQLGWTIQAALFDRGRFPKLYGPVQLLALVGLLVLFVYPTPIWERVNGERTAEISLDATPEMLELIRAGTEPDQFIFTDLPLYAILVERPIPPELAVLSSKRLSNGSVTEADLVDILAVYEPEFVLLDRHIRRFYRETTYGYLDQHYETLVNEERVKLYQRR